MRYRGSAGDPGADGSGPPVLAAALSHVANRNRLAGPRH
jgi:hypothetical protein